MHVNVRPSKLRTRLLLAHVALGVAIVAPLVGAAQAHADTVADDYTVRHGVQVCADIDKQRDDDGIDAVLLKMFADGLDGKQAGTVLYQSMTLFCPGNEAALRHWAGAPAEDQPVAPGSGSVVIA